MFECLKNYDGIIYLNDKKVENNFNFDNFDEDLKIHLVPNLFLKTRKEESEKKESEYLIEVRSWMLKKSTPEFLFQKTWNNDIPIPLKIMKGKILKETTGMYRFKLSGYAQKTCTCTRCGRILINPISKIIGIGPECCSKVGIDIDITCDEAKNKLEELKKEVENISWEGWIPKSSILEMTEL